MEMKGLMSLVWQIYFSVDKFISFQTTRHSEVNLSTLIGCRGKRRNFNWPSADRGMIIQPRIFDLTSHTNSVGFPGRMAIFD